MNTKLHKFSEIDFVELRKLKNGEIFWSHEKYYCREFWFGKTFLTNVAFANKIFNSLTHSE